MRNAVEWQGKADSNLMPSLCKKGDAFHPRSHVCLRNASPGILHTCIFSCIFCVVIPCSVMVKSLMSCAAHTSWRCCPAGLPQRAGPKSAATHQRWRHRASRGLRWSSSPRHASRALSAAAGLQPCSAAGSTIGVQSGSCAAWRGRVWCWLWSR
jgi:hypothetical protein